MLIAWLVGALGIAGGAIAALVLGLKLRGANGELELLRFHYRLASQDLRDTREASVAEIRRKQEEAGALRTQLDSTQTAMEALARAHPEIARDYFRRVLTDAAAGTVGDTHAPLPRPTAAGVAGSGGGNG